MSKDTFTPMDWYWRSEDDRVYSSKRQAVVDADDPDFLEWQKERAALPTVWPRDESNEQSNEALQEVLTAYNLTISE